MAPIPSEISTSSKTPQEFIQWAFSPVVAVLSSHKVDSIVSKNNLSFVELLQPFCSLSSEGQIRDPSGTQCVVRNWRLIIRDVHWKPPPPTEARKLLNSAVNLNSNEQNISFQLGRHNIEIPSSTPWFDVWRETYLEVQFPSDHEFTKHYVACMIVGSTLDGNVTDTFSALVQQIAQLQTVTPPRLPKWFNSNVLRSYVLLHDVSTGNKDKAERAFETLKQTYGAGNCFLLCINSKSEGEPDADHVVNDPWARFIVPRSETSNDLDSNNGSLPRTPVDARAMSSLPNSVSTSNLEESNNYSQPGQDNAVHPLSPSDDNLYDNGNSLKNTTLSGSCESMASLMNTNVWESTTSATAGPVQHGAALGPVDLATLQNFVTDFAFKALLPYFERQISQLHDAVANRKGVSRSLLSATKRWFGTTKPGTNTNANTVIYSADCGELQLRRLGDLWLMCGQWARAFDAYHTAKREFSADGAWLCYAGALEMAALSAYLADEPTRKTYAYMEEGILTYLNTCRMVQYAVRATLLSAACLIERGLHGEAARQLIRMTSEDSDLRSALLLEQAALCFLRPARPMPRKYAFHMVLAGHRYSKAGQKRHAYRCYQQAYQVYDESGWRLASEHVQFALGRLAAALRRAGDARRWLALPLAPHSPQPPHHHAALLREYMLAHQQFLESTEEYKTSLPILPLPLLESNETVVRCGGIAPLTVAGRVAASGTSLEVQPDNAADALWAKMEEMLLHATRPAPPMIFKPTINLFTKHTDNTTNPTVPRGEPIQLTFQLHNPLKVPLTLLNVELLWQFEPDPQSDLASRGVLSNELAIAANEKVTGDVISCPPITTLVIDSEGHQTVTMAVTPLHVGKLNILGVAYTLCNSVEGGAAGVSGTLVKGKQAFEMRGPPLRRAKDSMQRAHAVDRRLEIIVEPSAPCLQMTFSELSPELLCGEVQRVEVEFRNAGGEELRGLHVAVSHPDCLCLVAPDDPFDHFAMLHEHKFTNLPPDIDERGAQACWWRGCVRRGVRAVRGGAALPSGGVLRGSLLLRPARHAPALRLLAYYTSPHTSRHRLLRHTFNINQLESVKVVAIPKRNIKLKDTDKALESLSLAVEVKNVSKSSDGEHIGIEVLQSSLIGQQWRLTDCVAAASVREQIQPHEKLHLILRATRTSRTNKTTLEYSGLKLNPSHPEALPEVNVLPFSKFVSSCASPFVEDSERRHDRETKPDTLIKSMLVLRWKAHVVGKGTRRTAIGQHYLWLECFTSPISSQLGSLARYIETPSIKLFGYDEIVPENNDNKRMNSSQTKDIVMYRLEHFTNVTHDFKSRKMCLVPVKLHLVNCWETDVKAFIDVSNTSKNTSNVGWAGAVSGMAPGLTVPLRPFEARHVLLTALCTAPGVYQLGSTLALGCQAPGTPRTVQACSNPSLLFINQTM